MNVRMKVLVVKEIHINPLLPLMNQLQSLVGIPVDKIQLVKQHINRDDTATLDAILAQCLASSEVSKDASLMDVPFADLEHDVLLLQSGTLHSPSPVMRRRNTSFEEVRPNLASPPSSAPSRPFSIMVPSPTTPHASSHASSHSSSAKKKTPKRKTIHSSIADDEQSDLVVSASSPLLSVIPSNASPPDQGDPASQPQVKKWKQRQQLHAQQRADARSKRIFGVPLEELLIRPTSLSLLETGSVDSLVPPVIVSLVNHIRTHGTTAEGLFRLAGHHQSIQDMKRAMDGGELIEWGRYDIHSVANLLKLFLRELPEPLFTFRFFDRWINAIKFSPPSTADAPNLRMDYILALLAALPRPNKNLLHYLFAFLNELAVTTSGTTKMDAHNLAVVLGPNLIQPTNPPSDPVELMSLQSQIIDLVEIFIELSDTLFADLEEVSPFQTYRSLNPYTPVLPGELSIATNDIVHVFKKTGDVWYGEIDGRIGAFPHKGFKYEKTAKKQFRDWKQRSLLHLASGARESSRVRSPRDLESIFLNAPEGVSTKTIPRGFDPDNAELYLEDQEFQTLMGYTKGEFIRLPAWKKEQLKAKAGLLNKE